MKTDHSRLKVFETFQLNGKFTALECEWFDDEMTTKTIRTNTGTYQNFDIPRSTLCFSPPKSRHIVVFEIGTAEESEFVEFV